MSLPDTVKLESANSRTSGFSSTTITDGNTTDGSAIANQTNKDRYLTAEFAHSYSTAPTADKTVKIYIKYAVNGTNYEDTGTLIGTFSPVADTSSYREVRVANLPLLPFKFKIAVENVDTAQTITLTVNAYTHNDALVD